MYWGAYSCQALAVSASDALRRLPHDEDAGRRTGTQHWTRAERQMCVARPAGTHGGQQLFEGGIDGGCRSALPDQHGPGIMSPQSSQSFILRNAEPLCKAMWAVLSLLISYCRSASLAWWVYPL